MEHIPGFIEGSARNTQNLGANLVNLMIRSGRPMAEWSAKKFEESFSAVAVGVIRLSLRQFLPENESPIHLDVTPQEVENDLNKGRD